MLSHPNGLRHRIISLLSPPNLKQIGCMEKKNIVWCRELETLTLNLKGFYREDNREEVDLMVNAF